MNDYKIQIRKLYKSYKSGASTLDVLKGIDLNIKNNEFVAIQGPSGAGKSTLLHILGGLDTPTRGDILFDGESIYDQSDREKSIFRNRKIGFVFQFFHLLPELSALENVLLPRLLKSWWEKNKATDYAKSILDSLGLNKRLGHKPKQLSGGEQQRVAIARALINQPQVLLCDEPTGNLDSENGENILKLLRDIHKQNQATIILVTHEKDIAKVASRIVHIRDGLIVN
jgi:lipoprotein-releasing system ATP-binding protein